MKRQLFTFLIFISFASTAQTDLERWLATSPTQAGSVLKAREQLNPFIQSLSENRNSDVRLLRKAYRKIHDTFLKKYEAYSNFDQIFSNGQYDCLTATALFSYVLDQLELKHDLIETNYHIFLVVKTTRGDVLIETTDPSGGFVTGKEAIAERIRMYGKNGLGIDGHPSEYHYRYSFSLCQKISSVELAGLMYFNQAVKAYNHHDWEKCSALLETAHRLYASPRCEELGIILIRTLLDSTLDDKVKASCLARLRNYWAKGSQPLAAN